MLTDHELMQFEKFGTLPALNLNPLPTSLPINSMIPAIDTLNEAISELEEWCDYNEGKVAEHEMPSALVLTVDPRETPNARGQICGDVEVLVQALLVVARGNDAFRVALVDALPAFYRLAK